MFILTRGTRIIDYSTEVLRGPRGCGLYRDASQRVVAGANKPTAFACVHPHMSDCEVSRLRTFSTVR